MNKFMGVDVGKIKGLSKTKDPDFALYVARVMADGGVIVDYDYLHRSIIHAKDNGYWSNLRFWTSPSFGVKKDGANAVSKLYDLKGNDVLQGTGARQPTWSVSGLKFKPSILYNGTSRGLVAAINLGVNTAFCAFVVEIQDSTKSGEDSSFTFSATGTTRSGRLFYAITPTFYNSFGFWSYDFGTIAKPLNIAFIRTATLSENKSSLNLYINGDSPQNISTLSGLTNPGTGVSVGMDSSTARFHKGYISDTILLNNESTYRSIILSYLNAYYAIY